jgi:hypothetical protein
MPSIKKNEEKNTNYHLHRKLKIELHEPYDNLPLTSLCAKVVYNVEKSYSQEKWCSCRLTVTRRVPVVELKLLTRVHTSGF